MTELLPQFDDQTRAKMAMTGLMLLMLDDPPVPRNIERFLTLLRSYSIRLLGNASDKTVSSSALESLRRAEGTLQERDSETDRARKEGKLNRFVLIACMSMLRIFGELTQN